MVKDTNMQESYHEYDEFERELIKKMRKLTCDFCDKPCGHEWCPVNQEEKK